MIVSVPVSASWTLPETGASSIAAPSARARSASAVLASGLTVLMSTQIFPAASPASRPSGPAAIASSAASSVTMLKTTSAVSATSRGVSRQTRPSSSSGAALSLGAVPADQRVAGGDEPASDPATHRSETDEPDRGHDAILPDHILDLRDIGCCERQIGGSEDRLDLVGPAEAHDRAVDCRVAQRPRDGDGSRGRSVPFGDITQAARRARDGAIAAVHGSGRRACASRPRAAALIRSLVIRPVKRPEPIGE